jgi:hypothetical protein
MPAYSKIQAIETNFTAGIPDIDYTAALKQV